MKDMRAVRFNEKVKRLSTLVGNGGLALLVAAVARWYATDRCSVAFSGPEQIWSGMQLNELLESEGQ